MVNIYIQLSGFALNVLRKISRKCRQICGNDVVFVSGKIVNLSKHRA